MVKRSSLSALSGLSFFRGWVGGCPGRVYEISLKILIREKKVEKTIIDHESVFDFDILGIGVGAVGLGLGGRR